MSCWRNGEFTTLSDQPFWEASPDINDNGQIVWKGFVDGAPETAQLFRHADGVTTQLTDNALSNQGPRINELGQVVWTRYDFSVSPWTSEIMLYDDGDVTQLSAGQGQVGSPHLNDVGAVVWGSSQGGVELWRDGSTTQIAPHGSAPRINNEGTVAMARWDATYNNNALWVFLNGKLLQLTDGAFGGAVPNINERGEIAMRTRFFPTPGTALLTHPGFIADVDSDGDIDLADFGVVQRCYDADAGISGGCSAADLTGDNEVDSADFVAWFQWLEGPR